MQDYVYIKFRVFIYVLLVCCAATKLSTDPTYSKYFTVVFMEQAHISFVTRKNRLPLVWTQFDEFMTIRHWLDVQVNIAHLRLFHSTSTVNLIF